MVIPEVLIAEIKIKLFIEKHKKYFCQILSKFILFPHHMVYKCTPYKALLNDLKHSKVNLMVIKEVIRLKNKASKNYILEILKIE